MTIRSDVSVNWSTSPRLLTVAAPSTEITIQDIVDTCRNYEDLSPNSSRKKLIDAAGKEFLGGTTYVGITATLQNAVIAFEARPAPNWILCTIAGGNIVAVDAAGGDINPRYPTAFVTVDRTASASATLQEQSAIQYASFSGGVTVDVVNGDAGTEFPIGTVEKPVNNISDAKIIALDRGFSKFFIVGDIVIGATDNIDGYDIVGQNWTKTEITLDSGCSTVGCEISSAHVHGTLDGNTTLLCCEVCDLTYIEGVICESLLVGTIVLAGSAHTNILDCWDGLPGIAKPTIDCGGSGRGLTMSNYSGGVKLINKTGTESISLNVLSGDVTLDSTIINGEIYVRGMGQLTNNSTGSAVVYDYSVNATEFPGTIATAVWSKQLSDLTVVGSIGNYIKSKLLSVAKFLALK